MTSHGAPPLRAPIRRPLTLSVLALVLGLGMVACGGSNDPPLPPLAAEGRDIIRSSGCSACHGSDGDGGVGPSWIGLYGTTVELEGGDTVTVDDEYLHRSITDPAADKVAGYTVVMPNNHLDDDQIAAVVAYIRELR
jgi:cytochrome c oxidase subunit 2